MNVTGFNVNVTSEQPDRLKDFYREVVGLKPNPDYGEGAFDAGGTHVLRRRPQRDEGRDQGAAARADQLLRR